jgi:hypothetical protein
LFSTAQEGQYDGLGLAIGILNHLENREIVQNKREFVRDFGKARMLHVSVDSFRQEIVLQGVLDAPQKITDAGARSQDAIHQESLAAGAENINLPFGTFDGTKTEQGAIDAWWPIPSQPGSLEVTASRRCAQSWTAMRTANCELAPIAASTANSSELIARTPTMSLRNRRFCELCGSRRSRAPRLSASLIENSSTRHVVLIDRTRTTSTAAPTRGSPFSLRLMGRRFEARCYRSPSALG